MWRDDIGIGVVGLGLMGSSIVVALLAAGHPVCAVAPLPEDLAQGPARIHGQLKYCEQMGLLKEDISAYLSRLHITDDYTQLAGSRLVLECVIEQMTVKEQVYQKIADAISADAVIASNTSAIPISALQQHVPAPERFMGIHWSEPAYATRFLEITCGAQTLPQHAEWVFQLAHHWGKEPTLLKKDIRGFITNRLMYAVYREALHLVEAGETTLEDVDRAARYDTGAWITLMGIFRRMDLEGLEDAGMVLRNLFPRLSRRQTVPEVMQRMAGQRVKGVQDACGLYTYTPEEAARWAEAFTSFNRDIWQLAARWPADAIHK